MDNLPHIETNLPEVMKLETHVYIGRSFIQSDAANRCKLALDLVSKVLGFNDKMVFSDSVRKHPAYDEEQIVMTFSFDEEGFNEWQKIKEHRKKASQKTRLKVAS